MRSPGFTFIEMLLAVAIFAVVGLASASVLSSVLDTDAASRAAEQRLVQLQRFFNLLERDLAQISSRQIRLDGDEPLKSILIGEKLLFDSEEDAMAFVHHGWRNPGMVLPRSEIQAVAYRLKEGRIERLFSLYPDAVTGTEPKVQPLLDHVTGFKLEYLEGETWKEQWNSERLPKAIRLTITHESLGEIQRFYTLVDGLT
ncbi:MULTISPECIES: type II secretion system minor pseudopilin GspJ [Rheinheimera]|uniref:Type II secretion system protein J n=1 Tax=Rheinheimera marina TaxID=1774958 RepID=A0ABV9JHQ7_9GAMM